MSKKPPNRPGITFEIGARLEALDYLQKWYGKLGALALKHALVHMLFIAAVLTVAETLTCSHFEHTHTLFFFLVFLLFNRFCGFNI